MRCACGVEIEFLPTKKGKKMPVEVDSLTEEDLELLRRGTTVAYRYGDHTAHWETCEKRDEFKR